MKILLTIILILASLQIAFADWEIKPRYLDLQPNDGFMDAGTNFNPYVFKNQFGQEIGEIKSKYLDLTPNDGFMDAGSNFNPYKIDWK